MTDTPHENNSNGSAPPESAKTLGEQLGIGRNFLPVGFGWSLSKYVDSEGKTIHVIHIDSANGRFSFAMPAEHLREIGAAMVREATGGIQIAHDIPRHN